MAKFNPRTYDLTLAEKDGHLLESIREFMQEEGTEECTIETSTNSEAIELSKALAKYRRAYSEQTGDRTYDHLSISSNCSVTPPYVRIRLRDATKDRQFVIRSREGAEAIVNTEEIV